MRTYWAIKWDIIGFMYLKTTIHTSRRIKMTTNAAGCYKDLPCVPHGPPGSRSSWARGMDLLSPSRDALRLRRPETGITTRVSTNNRKTHHMDQCQPHTNTPVSFSSFSCVKFYIVFECRILPCTTLCTTSQIEGSNDNFFFVKYSEKSMCLVRRRHS